MRKRLVAWFTGLLLTAVLGCGGSSAPTDKAAAPASGQPGNSANTSTSEPSRTGAPGSESSAPDYPPAVALLPPAAPGGGAPGQPGAQPPAAGQGAAAAGQARAGAPTPVDTRPPDPGLEVVRELTQQFYKGDLVHLHDRFSAEMKTQLSVEQLAAIRTKAEQDFGHEVALIGEDWQRKGKYRGFVRWAKFSKSPDPIEIQWILHLEDDEVAGFFMQPTKKTETN